MSLFGALALGCGVALGCGLALGCAAAPPLVPDGSSSASSSSGGAQPAVTRLATEPTPVDAEPTPEELVARALVFDLPAPDAPDTPTLSLWATYYYVPEVRHAGDGFALRDMSDQVLGAKLSRRDWCEAAMQGTVFVTLADGASVTFNYAGTRKNVEVDCKPVYPKHPAIGRSRYVTATGPYGDGVRDMVLIPYRTLAVDPDTIPFGSLVYIEAARGTQLTLPDGSEAVHDGYFFAADRGGAIKETHIDVFVGMGKQNPFAFVKSKSSATFAARVLTRSAVPEAFDRLKAGHEAFASR